MAMHAFQNLLAVLVAMQRCGLDPASTIVFRKDYRYPRRMGVLRSLRRAGYRVHPMRDLHRLSMEQIIGSAGQPVLIIEDGGHVAGRLLSDPAAARRVLGAVEQTTKGIRRIAKAQRRTGALYPTVSVPASRLKQLVEPPYIGNASVQAFQAILGHQALRHKVAAVLGVGAIGAELMRALEAACVSVRYFDRDPERMAVQLPRTCGVSAASASEAVRGASIVFGATGQCSVDAGLLPHLADGVWLASVSSDAVEFDLDAIAAASEGPPRPIRLSELHERQDDRIVAHEYRVQGRRVRVLLQGRPINFAEFGAMPDEAADLILTIIFLSAVDVARRRIRGRGIRAAAADRVARRHGLAKQWLALVAPVKGGTR
jgi:S-adenosylhomocysteine hydrolase